MILKTNGSAANRQLYTDPATLLLCTTTPYDATLALGNFIYRIEYEFSGRKAPGLTSLMGDIPKPLPLPVPVEPQEPGRDQRNSALDRDSKI